MSLLSKVYPISYKKIRCKAASLLYTGILYLKIQLKLNWSFVNGYIIYPHHCSSK